jgi:hypothetical protein
LRRTENPALARRRDTPKVTHGPNSKVSLMRIAIALCFALFSSALHAETGQYGNVIFDLPAGWKTGNDYYGYQIVIEDTGDPCKSCYLYVGLGSPKSGDLLTFLEAQKELFLDDDDKGSEQIISDPDLVDFSSYPAALLGMKVGGKVVLMLALELPDRYEIFGFEGGATDEETMTASIEVFQTQALGIILGAKYVSEGAAPLLPAAEPGDLTGIWWGFGTETKLGLDGYMKYEMAYRKIVFWPDGYFYDGTPPLGLQPLDTDALYATGDMDFGTYRIDGDGLTLNWAAGWTEVLDPDGDEWSDGDMTLGPVEALDDGEVLDGSISSFSISNFAPGTGVTGGSFSYSDVTFRPDGSYLASGSGGVSVNVESAEGDNQGGLNTTSEDPSATGTYEIRDGLLITTPADGAPPSSKLIFRALDEIMIGDREFSPAN